MNRRTFPKKIPRIYLPGSLQMRTQQDVATDKTIYRRMDIGAIPDPDFVIVDGHGEKPGWTKASLQRMPLPTTE